MKKIHVAFLLIFTVFLVCAPLSSAQPQEGGPYEFKSYKIEKGDTLWDISGKELNNPFQWPLIWKENPQIKNPDRILPDETIRIPVEIKEAPLAEAVAPAKKPEEAVKPEEAKAAAPEVKEEPKPARYLFSKNEILSSGFIARKVPKVGEIMAPVNYREMLASGDDVYLKLDSPVAPGDKFIAAGIRKINHPVAGNPSGYLVEPRGLVEVTEIKKGKVRAVVLSAYERIGRGDALLKYEEPVMIAAAGAPREPSVSGYVMAIKNMRTLGGQFDILYLDKGRADGLQPADLLYSIKGPDANGLLQIVSVTEHYATAVVKKSLTDINPGDPFTGISLNGGAEEAYSTGLSMLRAGEGCKNAYALFWEAIEKDPAHAEAHLEAGYCSIELGRYPDALKAFKQAVLLKPDCPKGHYNLGVAYGLLGRHEEAIAEYRQAISITPEFADAHYNLAVAYQELRRYPEAMEAFKNTIRIKPDYLDAYNNLGLAYRMLGRNEEAISAFKQAISINPDYARAHYNLGLTYLAVGDKAAALNQYKTLKALDTARADKLHAQISN